MRASRRTFIRGTALAAGAAAAGCSGVSSTRPTVLAPGLSDTPHPAITALKPMTTGVTPISDGERRGRIEKAQRLMTEQKVGAIVIEGGSSMFYFTGTRWGLSERPFVVIIPAKGELAYVTPGFEESRAREITKFTNDIRVWQEDESPYKVIAGVLRDRGVATGESRARRTFPLFHRRRSARRDAHGHLRPGHANHRGLPDVQDRGRDRAHAARQRHHDRSVQGRAPDAPRRHDRSRLPRQHRGGVPRARRHRFGARAVRPVVRTSSRHA